MSAELNQGTLDAVLEISSRRAKTLHEIRALLEDDRDSEALSVMRNFLQVKKKPKTSRADRRYPRSLALVKGK